MNHQLKTKNIFFSALVLLAFFSGAFFIKAQNSENPSSGTVLLSPDPDNAIPGWFSTAKYPTFSGPVGNILMSDGKNWKSAKANLTGGVGSGGVNIKTFLTKPFLATGALLSLQNNSQTESKVGLFNLPADISVNELSYNVSGSDTAGKYKICIYDETGQTKLIDVENAPMVGANNVVIDPAVLLSAGNYYVAMGCGSEACDNAIVSFVSSSSNIINGADAPTGKIIYEGTVSHDSGVCADTLGNIKPSASQTPVIRLDE